MSNKPKYNIHWKFNNGMCHVYLGDCCIADISGCENMSDDEIMSIALDIINRC